jgi:hypothetical protein
MPDVEQMLAMFAIAIKRMDEERLRLTTEISSFSTSTFLRPETSHDSRDQPSGIRPHDMIYNTPHGPSTQTEPNTPPPPTTTSYPTPLPRREVASVDGSCHFLSESSTGICLISQS